MSIECPQCGQMVTFIPFGFGHVAVCCGVVLSSLSGAEPQVAGYPFTRPDAARAPADADTRQ